jgi:hypothetical protein
MGKAIPTQHPAVVLRSHYRQLRALLGIAMIAVVGLTAALVILATNDERDSAAGSATQVSAPGPAGPTRYDGGPEEGSRAIGSVQPRVTPDQAFPGLAREATSMHLDATRYDGGPEEGSRGPVPAQPPSTRYDGGPEEGTRGAPSFPAPPNTVHATRYDGGPEEGSRGPTR